MWRRRESARSQAERAWRSRRGSFDVAGERLRYHSAAYNATWANAIAIGFRSAPGGAGAA
jgi:hypothetical protein